MQRTGQYYSVVPIADGMKKFARITGTIGSLATNGKLIVSEDASEFITQFEEYGPAYSGFDDDLDASALALQDLSQPFLEEGTDPFLLDDDNIDKLGAIRMCP